MSQVEVQIMGQSYLLSCPAGGEPALQAAVQRVDDAMCRIRDAGKIKARDRIAVLAALNLAASAPATSESAVPLVTPVQPAPKSSAPMGVAPAAVERLALLRSKLDAALQADGQLI